MADLSKCQPDNWFEYLPEKQYCTLMSKGDIVIMSTFNGELTCTADQLTYIKVSLDVLSVCKFVMHNGIWMKKVGKFSLTVTFDTNNKPYLSATQGTPIPVGHVHTLQNVYKDLTGDSLTPNLYGIRPPL